MKKILQLIMSTFLIALVIKAEFSAASDTIFVKDMAFRVNSPGSGTNTLTIQEGQEVVFKWIDGIHDVTSTNASPAWSKFDMTAGSNIKVLNLSAGTYTYKCSIHSSMTGAITVNPTISGTTSSKAKYELSIVPDYYDNQITFNLNAGGQNNLRGIKVFDIIGKEVAFVDLLNRSGSTSYTVNFSHLKPGIYLCSLYSDKGILETRRFIWN